MTQTHAQNTRKSSAQAIPSASSSTGPANSKRARPNPSLPNPAPRSAAGSALKAGSAPRLDSGRQARGSRLKLGSSSEPSSSLTTTSAMEHDVPEAYSTYSTYGAQPDFDAGVAYWSSVDKSVDGVLGGFGTGPVPHIEALGSRLFLLGLCPQLHTFESPLTPFPAAFEPQAEGEGSGHRRTALDVGAGIGRVTRSTLLPLFEDVVLVEPVGKFIREGMDQAKRGEWVGLGGSGINAGEGAGEGQAAGPSGGQRGKRVRFVQKGLQGLDLTRPGRGAVELGVVGQADGLGPEDGWETDETGGQVYDVIWCQWCLGHMSSPDLVEFLRIARRSLRPSHPFPWPTAASGPAITESGAGVDAKAQEQAAAYDDALRAGRASQSFICVKENVCEDHADGSGREFLDEEDSSLTRSNAKWLDIFAKAGLEVVREETQVGMPAELFPVKTWALR